MAARARLNVQTFPRPPLNEKISRHIQIKWKGTVTAETTDAYWVLETHHPPNSQVTADYIPPDAMKVNLANTRRSIYCEWKGAAIYYAAAAPGTGETVSNRIWSYDSPSRGFEPIRGYLSLYAGPWECFVDGELVEAQPGDFYGGWVTSEIEGIVKGRNGNFDPDI
ncbi:hypothetical protein BN1723_011293 [Verticillium longisporum]|uniref:DUF427 domain-containing protein n=1 Tax=Verticillium longisporum TaxID=100787 RepID=A0A0G4LHI0_VERLO|nr:hypothetical protein BN1723_011293 [Verticillium longisporum]CRK21487.1 hypothetical protein BN1708_013144 [Verticillium longisporum]